jgi:hypothetical protein
MGPQQAGDYAENGARCKTEAKTGIVLTFESFFHTTRAFMPGLLLLLK